MNWKIARCTLFLGFVGAFIATAFAQENPSVTTQLNNAKPIVAAVKKDAVQMQSYTQSALNWKSHAEALEKIKVDVNKLQENMRGLQSHRANASPAQQDAIDRITSLANQLATNMNNAIAQLNKSKSQPTAAPYPEYLKANTQLATDLTDEINAIIDYAQTKAKEDELQSKLPQ